MLPTKTLPNNYLQRGHIDLAKDRMLMLGLNIGGLALFGVFGLAFLDAAALLVPDLPRSGQLALNLLQFITILGIILVVMVLHELVHGGCYWLFTRERPVFGFKGLYAFAAAPQWYLPRVQFVLVGIAPFLLLTLLGLVLLRLLPPSMSLAVVFAMTINAAGAVGDLYMVIRIALQHFPCLIRDQGNRITWFAPF